MPKKIALIVRERQDEAIRMALGITLCDDTIDVFVMDKKVEESEKNNQNIWTMNELEMTLYTNCKDNEGMKFLSTEQIAVKLLEYDSILPY